MGSAEKPRSLDKVRGGMPNHCQAPTNGKRVDPAIVRLEKAAQTLLISGAHVQAKFNSWHRMPSEHSLTLRRRDGLAVLAIKGERNILSDDVVAHERREGSARRRSQSIVCPAQPMVNGSALTFAWRQSRRVPLYQCKGVEEGRRRELARRQLDVVAPEARTLHEVFLRQAELSGSHHEQGGC